MSAILWLFVVVLMLWRTKRKVKMAIEKKLNCSAIKITKLTLTKNPYMIEEKHEASRLLFMFEDTVYVYAVRFSDGISEHDCNVELRKYSFWIKSVDVVLPETSMPN